MKRNQLAIIFISVGIVILLPFGLFLISMILNILKWQELDAHKIASPNRMYGTWQRADKVVEFTVFPNGTVLQRFGTKSGGKRYLIGTWKYTESGFATSFLGLTGYTGAMPGGYFAGDNGLANGDPDVALGEPENCYYRQDDDDCIPKDKDKLDENSYVGKKYSYIDKTGKIVIAGPFCGALQFCQDTARVQWDAIDEMKRYVGSHSVINSLVDKKGIYVPFLEAPRFRTKNGMISLIHREQIDNGWIKSNPDMEAEAETIELKMDKCGQFMSEPVVFKMIKDETHKIGFIDSNGKVLIKPTYEYADNFSEGLAVVLVGDYYRYIKKDGSFAFEDRFPFAGSFSNGLAAVIDKNGEWGYIGKDGKFKIPAQFEWAGDFHDGLAPVKAVSGYAIIDVSGNVVAKTDYFGAMEFSEGLLPVLCSNGLWGYAGPDGKIVIPGSFEKALPFSCGLAAVIPGPEYHRPEESKETTASRFYVAGRNWLTKGEVPTGQQLMNSAIRYSGTGSIGAKAKSVMKIRGIDGVSFPASRRYQEVQDLVMRKRFDAAEESAREGALQFPNYLHFQTALAFLDIRNNRLDEAEKQLQELLKINPMYARAHLYLAECAEKRGDKKKELEHLNRALEIDPAEFASVQKKIQLGQ